MLAPTINPTFLTRQRGALFLHCSADTKDEITAFWLTDQVTLNTMCCTPESLVEQLWLRTQTASSTDRKGRWFDLWFGV